MDSFTPRSQASLCLSHTLLLLLLTALLVFPDRQLGTCLSALAEVFPLAAEPLRAGQRLLVTPHNSFLLASFRGQNVKKGFFNPFCTLGWRFSLLPLVEGGLEKEHPLWSPSGHEKGQSTALVELSQAGGFWHPPSAKFQQGRGAPSLENLAYNFVVG